MAAAIGLVHQDGYGAAHQGRRCPARQLLGGCIGQFDTPFGVDDDHRIGGVAEDRLQSIFQRQQAFATLQALGHVFQSQDHASCSGAIALASGQDRQLQGPGLGAIATGDFERPGTGRQRPSDQGVQSLQVAGSEEVGQSGASGAGRRAGCAPGQDARAASESKGGIEIEHHEGEIGLQKFADHEICDSRR